MVRGLIGGFLVVLLECRKLSVTWEDILAAWLHTPAIEMVVPAPDGRERLLEKIDEVYPF